MNARRFTARSLPCSRGKDSTSRYGSSLLRCRISIQLMSQMGHKQTFSEVCAMSASLIGRLRSSTFRLSAAAVSMSLTGSCFSSESAPGPSTMGFEDEVEQSIPRPCRQFERQVQADMRTHLIHRPARDIFPLLGWISGFLLSDLILNGFHAAAAVGCRVHRNSVPSTHMRCMMTASLRARATIAFFIPRRLAICMAQALSQDHFFACNMLCAAS